MYLVEKKTQFSQFINERFNFGENFYLVLFSLYTMSQFYIGTMFPYVFKTTTFPYNLWFLISMFALVKVFMCDEYDDWKTLALCTTVGFLMLISSQKTYNWNFIYYYVMVIAARNVDYKKIVKVFLCITSICLIVTIIAAKLRFIPGIVNSRTGDPGVRYALGTVFPTDLAARCFYLLLFYAILRRFKFTMPEYIASVAFTVLIYVITDTKLDTILMIFTILSVFFYEPLVKAFQFLGYKIVSLIGLAGVFAMIMLTYLYSPHNKFFILMDKVLTKRLSNGHRGFVDFNVELFGQPVPQHGNGGLHSPHFDYFFIDCSFIRMLLMNGLIVFIIVMATFCYLIKRFLDNKLYFLAIAVILIVLSSLIDHHMSEISFNIIFLATFANLGSLTKKKDEPKDYLNLAQ
ncbi:beta-carotene 15,15'-monooxygenase [Ligilactobacillus acidipiscis]|uniref:beta-carotene 15,15'-monooxygenase n=1 Tax=Ligilactobacillus acidipiscis TaxID=89059 RepID=UPI0023F6A6BA|nr:beta-carotene 15,15'-monooxygenase [Ligilactobacillus acidipiscis]WEV56577.1 beta-carotene 15,15'-monooxygenase [Ligilactobacillus acidipiscis]